jgi:hypothetical protein
MQARLNSVRKQLSKNSHINLEAANTNDVSPLMSRMSFVISTLRTLFLFEPRCFA